MLQPPTLRKPFKQVVAVDSLLHSQAVVYSDFQNDLEQVTNWLVKEVGQDAVAQHWGDYRSTELARFRNGRISYRECPRCGFQNEEQVPLTR